MDSQAQKARIDIEYLEGVWCFKLSGAWKLGGALPRFESLASRLDSEEGMSRIAFDTADLQAWDSGLLTFLLRCLEYCRKRGWQFDLNALPGNMRSLIDLSRAVPEKLDVGGDEGRGSFLYNMGIRGIDFGRECMEFMTFTGECTLSAINLLRGRARMRWKDMWAIVQECGANALPIVTLISFLIGLIITFLGAVVLVRFGAEIYVSYLVGYGMLREMGAVMTGVIIAGRTGAAFAAQIGSMKVNEEIDALSTLGISPIDFIVLPRMLAMFLMMPLLVIYADVIGIIAGILVAEFMLGISYQQFINGILEAVGLPDMWLGVIKGTVFGVIIAVSGCLRGIKCGNSADAVGLATTSAVVTGITLIIFANAIIDWIAAIYGV